MFSATYQPAKSLGQGFQSPITTKIKSRLESKDRISGIEVSLSNPNGFPDHMPVKVWATNTNLGDLIDIDIHDKKIRYYPCPQMNQ